MIHYLQEWLKKRVNAAPVWATLRDEQQGTRYVMRAVDEVGVVLAPPSSPDDGAAFPWSSILSITPDKSK
jgi:hypothetical protein